MKFVCIGILQQPIGTLQIPSRDCKEFFKFAKLMRKIPNELQVKKRNASRSLPVMHMLLYVLESFYLSVSRSHKFMVNLFLCCPFL
jgi:hypothetical protein